MIQLNDYKGILSIIFSLSMDSLRTPEGKYGLWNRFVLAYNIDPHKYEKKGQI